MARQTALLSYQLALQKIPPKALPVFDNSV